MICESHTDVERSHKGRPRNFDHGQVLTKALRLFWENGYETTSVAELCKAMGVSPPSLYSCFGNKAQLFVEAVLYYEKTYWEKPSLRFATDPDIYNAVASFFDEAASILVSPDTPCGCMVVLAAINVSKDATDVIEIIQRLRNATKTMFATRIRKAIRDGELPAETDEEVLALALNTFLEGLSLQARDGLDRAAVKAVAARAKWLLPPKPTQG